MPKIPYTKLYMTDWLSWRRKLPPETLCQILDSIADYCLFGDKPELKAEVKPEDKARVIEVLTTLMKWTIDCEKAYRSNSEKGKKGGRPKTGAKKAGLLSELKAEVKPELLVEDKVGIKLRVKQPEPEPNKENNTNVLSKKNLIDWEYVLNRWNEIATKWKRPTMRALTESRKKHFSARFKEYGGEIEKLFEEIDYRLETSLSLRGKQINKEGELENSDWAGADFDFLCRPEKFLRIIEGGYRDADLEGMYEKKKQMAIAARIGGENGN